MCLAQRGFAFGWAIHLDSRPESCIHSYSDSVSERLENETFSISLSCKGAPSYTSVYMLKAIHLVFSPFQAWTKVAAEQRSIGFILFCSLLPLLLLCVGVESYSLIQWGELRSDLGLPVRISEPVALRYAAAHISLFFACALFGGFSLQAVAQSFNLAATFRQGFTAMAYGISPLVLVRLLDAIPAMNSWVCWGIGGMLALSVLYHGVALILKPDQTKGFGLYIVSAMIVLLSTGVSHFIALAVLHEKILR
jgi:hypothetical protein